MLQDDCAPAIKSLLCQQSQQRFVLIDTGNRNRDLNRPISFTQKYVGLLRLFATTHVDNRKPPGYLRTQIGQNNTSMGMGCSAAQMD
jgi:hypothetical protein